MPTTYSGSDLLTSMLYTCSVTSRMVLLLKMHGLMYMHRDRKLIGIRGAEFFLITRLCIIVAATSLLTLTNSFAMLIKLCK